MFAPLLEDLEAQDTLAFLRDRLCRFHHRLKTHGHWTYQRQPDGSYHWTSPYDQHFVVDSTGTTPLT